MIHISPCSRSWLRKRPFAGGSSGSTTRLHSAVHNTQIVCRHFGDNRSRESSGLRHRGNRFEVSQTRFGLRSRRLRSNAWLLGAVANLSRMYGSLRYNGAAEGSIAAAPLINPSVAFHGEMWTMLMQMIPSADAIGQTECDASSAMGARTFVTGALLSVAAWIKATHPVQDRKVENESREISRRMDDVLP
jgi:hypothetical protein